MRTIESFFCRTCLVNFLQRPSCHYRCQHLESQRENSNTTVNQRTVAKRYVSSGMASLYFPRAARCTRARQKPHSVVYQSAAACRFVLPLPGRKTSSALSSSCFARNSPSAGKMPPDTDESDFIGVTKRTCFWSRPHMIAIYCQNNKRGSLSRGVTSPAF